MRRQQDEERDEGGQNLDLTHEGMFGQEDVGVNLE
jgi:hypothetical protein